MRMMIQRADGVRAEAVLLAFDKNRMRLAIAGTLDTIELRMQCGCWVAEDGQTIEFDALLPMEGIGWQHLCTEVYPRTMAAGITEN